MAGKIILRISKLFNWVEVRCGLAVTSLIIGIILLGGAMLYVHPNFVPIYHGVQFSRLSIDPFDFTYDNNLRYRILAPVLGYISFLRGEYFIFLQLIFCLMLNFCVYYHYRKKDFTPLNSFIFVCFVSFSCVELIPIFAPGYTDIVTYFFIFLSFSRIKSQFQSALF